MPAPKYRDINKIIVHCADTDDDVGLKEITDWHKARGFSECGYHYIIEKVGDGWVNGRDLDAVGAHCLGQNHNSVGICGVWRHYPLPTQLQTLRRLCVYLMANLNLTVQDIYGHRDFTGKKTCPNLPTIMLRHWIEKG